MHTPTQAGVPSPNVDAATIEPRKLATDTLDVMDALLKLIEQETELVRAGQIAEAIKLETSKTDLSRHYVNLASALKANQARFRAAAPDLLTTLQRHHETFRAMLQVNLTVLATAHAVSEGVIRGVNAEVQRRNMPQTYTANGRRATPGPRHITPIAVSRSL